MSRHAKHLVVAAAAIAAALFFAARASGTAVWTGTDPLQRQAAFSTGTEVCSALGLTDGFSLSGVSGFSVKVSSVGWTGYDAGVFPGNSDVGPYLIVKDAAMAFTACVLQACACQDSNFGCNTGSWARAPDSDLSLTAVTSQIFTGFTAANRRDRIAWVPSGCGQPSVELIVGTATSLFR